MRDAHLSDDKAVAKMGHPTDTVFELLEFAVELTAAAEFDGLLLELDAEAGLHGVLDQIAESHDVRGDGVAAIDEGEGVA